MAQGPSIACNNKSSKAEKLLKQLYELRMGEYPPLLTLAEKFINSLTHTPKFLTRGFSSLEASVISFSRDSEGSQGTALKSSLAHVAGIGATAGAAKVMPEVTMKLTRKFGKASTGRPIKTLSGAAAKNATLARIGGGALSAGGGGIAAGREFLKQEPLAVVAVGATVGRRKLVNSVLRYGIEKVYTQIRRIAAEAGLSEGSSDQLTYLISSTKYHLKEANDILLKLQTNAPNDYWHYSRLQKQMLRDCNNHIETLAKLMKRGIMI